jgi:hypothetical protein
MRLKYTSTRISLCNLLFELPFCRASCNEQSYLVLCLYPINHGNKSSFQGMLYILSGSFKPIILSKEYRVVSQPSGMCLKISILY